jgi:hypothetical protein
MMEEVDRDFTPTASDKSDEFIRHGESIFFALPTANCILPTIS